MTKFSRHDERHVTYYDEIICEFQKMLNITVNYEHVN